ncbi:MAG: tetratricopeptide repeat protein [Casimicrobiaceae bacterium]
MNESFEKAREYFLAGISAFESGRFGEAETDFELSLAMVPGRVSTLNNLASARIHLAKPDAALAALEIVLAREPDNLEALSHRGAALAQLDRHADALACYERVLAADPDRRAVIFHRGTTLGLLDRDPEAIAEFDRLLILEPRHAEAWLRRGQSLLRQVEHEQALESCAKALAIDPLFAEAWTVRGTILAELKRHEEAAAAFEQAIANGGDEKLNGFFLAGMRSSGPPAAPPRHYVETLFDEYAGTFDDHLVQVLHYQAHNILIESLRLLTSRRFERALDLGCGTGLCGVLLQPIAAAIDGVDLSANMLEKAAGRHVYAELVHADIGEHLHATGQRYDLVVAGDVFIYIGDLSAIFAGVVRVLDAGGAFCFSAELVDDNEDFVLRSTLRYAQSERFIRRLAREHGFAIDRIDRRPVREDRHQPIAGLFVFLTRA